MQPADLWAIAATMPPNQLPPAQFDHPVLNPVEIVDVATEDRLRTLCGWPAKDNMILVGCAATLPTLCRIYVGPPRTRETGITRNLIIRHEMGHCSGWPKDHSNPLAKGAPLQLAADEGVEPPVEDYPPPPSRRRPPPRYYEPPPPPGVLYEPWQGRAIPCLPTLLSLGLVRFCI
jgi:hypothetical protein